MPRKAGKNELRRRILDLRSGKAHFHSVDPVYGNIVSFGIIRNSILLPYAAADCSHRNIAAQNRPDVAAFRGIFGGRIDAAIMEGE